MSILDHINVSDLSMELLNTIEDSIQERRGDKESLMSSREYRIANQMITKKLVEALPSGNYCNHCKSAFESYPHSCGGYYAPSPQTRYWLDDQAS